MKILTFTLLCSVGALAAEPPQAYPNRPPLQPTPYRLLPLTSVRPMGWLKRQLRIQADGLSGHLDEFWPDLGPNSGWLGGTGESWERAPYFLDGLVPLAYLLDDPALIAKARKWLEWTLEHQRADGFIGPASNNDWWPRYVMLKALTQYQEATGDPRVIPLMERYFAYQASKLDSQPLVQWAVYRWQDEVLSILWLYNRNGDSRLLDLARKLNGKGYDWSAQFLNFRYTDKVTKDQCTLETHGVNNSQALKAAAVWWEVTGSSKEKEGLYNQFRALDKFHLEPNGMHSADEHYAGRDPSQGTELCSVVETMFSLEHILAITGDPAFADRLEKVAYNPLPGTFSKDMWAHQYDQQANQVLVSNAPRDWTSNGTESNLFGLEPNFGCCTANMHQGWPKFVSSMWMGTRDQGLAAAAYGPSEVSTRVRGNVAVTIVERTEYPFRDRIHLAVSPSAAVTFPLELHVPAWAGAAKISVNGKVLSGVRPGAFYRIEREWAKNDQVDLTLPMEARISRWYHGSVAVERGPLVYSLKIGEDWRKVKDRPRAPDWEVLPVTPWNYGLLLDPQHPAVSFQAEERPVGDYPFSPDGPPVLLKARGRRIAGWGLVHNSAGPLPESPASSNAPVEDLVLIPYGSAKLRVTAFPEVR